MRANTGLCSVFGVGGLPEDDDQVDEEVALRGVHVMLDDHEREQRQELVGSGSSRLEL